MIFVLELRDPDLPLFFLIGQLLIFLLELELAFGFGPFQDRFGRRRRGRLRRINWSSRGWIGIGRITAFAWVRREKFFFHRLYVAEGLPQLERQKRMVTGNDSPGCQGLARTLRMLPA